MRGEYYIWCDEANVHIWARDGYDGWDDSVWHDPEAAVDGKANASGVGIPQTVIDEFVVMRMAELVAAGAVVTVVDRAIEKWSGNFGCESLATVAARLRQLQEA